MQHETDIKLLLYYTVCPVDINTDRTGSDMNDGTQNIVASSEMCCLLCLSNPDCYAWAYVKDESLGNEYFRSCWLKNSVPIQTTANGIDSGVKPQT